MKLGLGIDTGGTYTDAVLVDTATGLVVESVKTLTTHHDLSVGIVEAIRRIVTMSRKKHPSAVVNMVGLSTTLATNAVVEGNGGRVCMILIGYDRALLHKYGFENEFITKKIVHVSGGYDLYGDEANALDENAIRRAVIENKNDIDSFGVVCFFGSRNPSQEIRAQEIIEKIIDVPVTCGHDLTTKLNSVLRAQTVAINASLIPLLKSLIISVQKSLSKLSIQAPLLVVKGDGSLMKADVAVKRPVETILSGPAASLIGAQRLSAQSDFWVVDIGGTTTDIGRVTGGRIELNKAGSTIAGRRTMVESADIYTIGLGGDSLVRVESTSSIKIGPKRVVPLCLLEENYPAITHKLRQLREIPTDKLSEGFFVLHLKTPPYGLAQNDIALLETIKNEPLLLQFSGKEGLILSRRLERLEKLGSILRAGFTPTDALHALDRLHLWKAEASRLGANILAEKTGQAPEDFCRGVIEQISEDVSAALVDKIVTDRLGPCNLNLEKRSCFFLNRAIRQDVDSEISCRLSLLRPIVAIGAPATAYMQRASEILNASLISPPHAEVANAFGAVVGIVLNQKRILITPIEGARKFRVHLPSGVKDFVDLEEAVAFTNEYVASLLEQITKKSGAENPSVQIEREDNVVQGIYLNTELIFTATGSPLITNFTVAKDNPQKDILSMKVF
jgi:N-methylhydantoinase A/oxoprolinase/acetone carboxylase beta subunit